MNELEMNNRIMQKIGGVDVL
ncbi:MAG: hypothetical protein K0S61_2099, partial [Anaerocolumna sp.]|nr:hypothetical protein [Anaerocolumna sp.]